MEATVPAIFAFSDPRACRSTRIVTATVNDSATQGTSPDYSGFPHTGACKASPTEYWEKTQRSPAG